MLLELVIILYYVDLQVDVNSVEFGDGSRRGYCAVTETRLP